MCEHPSSAPRLTRTQNVLLWIMQLLLVAAFVPTGLATLAAHPMMAEMFYKIGLGQWLRLLTGAIEIGAAELASPRVDRRSQAPHVSKPKGSG